MRTAIGIAALVGGSILTACGNGLIGFSLIAMAVCSFGSDIEVAE